MEQYIPKSALAAKIERKIKQFVKENNTLLKNSDNAKELRSRIIMCKEILSFLDTLEAKEVDLNEEIKSYFKGFGKFASVGIDDCIDIAKHFFELGLKVSNPITAADRGTAEEIIINLKRVEKDYRIDLTREISWLMNKVKINK